MKKLLQSLFVVAGLVLAVGVANAQTGSVVVDQYNGPTLEGTYQVTVTETAPLSNVFDVNVTELTSNPSLPTPPGAYLDEITLKFFSGTSYTSTQLNVASGSGGTAGGTWGFTDNGGTTAEWNSPGAGANVNALQDFNGVVTLSGPPVITDSSSSQIVVDLQNTGTGNGTITLTPESSAWLLLLAAVAPLGLLAWRKRSAFSRVA